MNNSNFNLSKVYYSTDGENYKEVGVAKETPKLANGGIVDNNNLMAGCGEASVKFKIVDKYYKIYKRTKKSRIKKKQLKRMNPLLAMSLILKKINFKKIKIKVGEHNEKS